MAHHNANNDKVREDIEKKACHYIVDSLKTVADDIENVGGMIF